MESVPGGDQFSALWSPQHWSPRYPIHGSRAGEGRDTFIHDGGEYPASTACRDFASDRLGAPVRF
jgi:hypothetical protein